MIKQENILVGCKKGIIMRYIIKYFDRLNRDKPKEERLLTLELNDPSSLADAIRLLQQNKYVIISAELIEE